MSESTHVLHCRWCGKPLEKDHVFGEYYDPAGQCRCHPENRYSGWMGGKGFHEPQEPSIPAQNVTNRVQEVLGVQPVKTLPNEGDTL